MLPQKKSLRLHISRPYVLMERMQNVAPQMDLTPFLPEFPVPATAESVAAYGAACLVAVGLVGWGFGWDCTVRRLGCCRYQVKRISLSEHFFRKFCVQEPALVRRTILHELAHALAYTQFGELRHGSCWRMFCAALGIGGEKASCRCEDFSPNARPYRYALCHSQTGAVYHRYKTRPRLSAERLLQTYIRGRKEETLGYLCIKPL